VARCFVFAIRLGNVIPQQTSSPANVATASAPKFVQGWAVFGDRDCDGFDDRVGHLYCPGGYEPCSGIAGAVDCRVAGDGADDHHWGFELRRAGGDDAEGRRAVCLSARVAGADLGIPLWWTLFLVIQTGTIAAVGVAFGKFLGVFFPIVSQTNWIWHVGSGNIGLSTANLAAIVIIVLLTWTNTRGVKLGAAIQNVFTSAKVLALLGIVAVGLVARNAVAMSANFGHHFWSLGPWKMQGMLSHHGEWVGHGECLARLLGRSC